MYSLPLLLLARIVSNAFGSSSEIDVEVNDEIRLIFTTLAPLALFFYSPDRPHLFTPARLPPWLKWRSKSNGERASAACSVPRPQPRPLLFGPVSMIEHPRTMP